MLQKYLFCFLFFLMPLTLKAQLQMPVDTSTQMDTLKYIEYAPINFFNQIPTFAPKISAMVERGNATNRLAENKTGLFFLALLFLFLFAFVRLLFPKYFQNLFQLFTSFNISKRHIKDQLEIDNRASVWFYFIYFLCTGYLFYTAIHLFNLPFSLKNTWTLFALCTLAVVFIIGIKVAFLKLLAWVFNGKEYVSQYLFTKRISNEFLGLLLFPCCILIMLSNSWAKPKLVSFSLALLLLSFVYNYIKNLGLVKNLMRINLLHFLIYLCAFEIMPILILVKVAF